MVKQKYAMEAFGAFALTLVVALGILGPIGAGLVLAGMIYFGAHVSGGHYNPAVTFAVWLKRKISDKDAMMYVIYQILGAVLATIVAGLISKDSPYGFAPFLGPSTTSYVGPVLAEVVFTAFLVYTVLMVSMHKKLQNNWYYGFAIGFTVILGGILVGNVSGGVFNPAVGVGLNIGGALVSALTSAKPGLAAFAPNYNNIILYTVAPLFGGLLAFWVYNLTQESSRDEK